MVAASLLPGRGFAQASIVRDGQRIAVPYGIPVDDVLPALAIIWAEADRPGRMLVRWSTSEDPSDAREVMPVHAQEDSNFAGKLDLMGLPGDQRNPYEVRWI